jgi:hypothetical protein
MYWFLLWFGDGAVVTPPAGGGSTIGTEVNPETQIEVWSNLQCAGGSRLAAGVPALSCIETQEIGDGIASSRLAMEFPAEWEGAIHVIAGRVIRLTYANGEFDEFRIDDIDESIPQDRISLTANSVIFDLAHATAFISETVGQKVSYSLTKTDSCANLISLVLGFSPSYFMLGTVTPTVKVSVVFDWAMPLAAHQMIGAAARAFDGSQYELSARRNGVAGYYLDLTVHNASAASPDLRTGKNVLTLIRKTIGQQFANRIYPSIAWADQAGAAEHHFIVTEVSANTYIAIDDPAFRGTNPVPEDDAYNGFYWVPYNESLTVSTARQITDSVRTTKRLYMSSTSGIAVGDLGRLAANSSKAFLGYIHKPTLQTSGVRTVRLDAPEQPIDNVLGNPSLSRWTAGAIDYWVSTGTAWPAEETVNVFTGTRSARLQNQATSNYYSFGPRFFAWTTRSNLVMKYRVWIKNVKNGDSGLVSMTISVADPATTSGLTVLYTPSGELTEWTAITSSEYAVTAGGRKRFEIVVNNTGTVVNLNARAYIGAVEALVYQSGTALPVGPVLGSNSTGAWLRGVAYLNTDPITYEVAVVDLYRHNSNAWPYDRILLGGTANVVNQDTGITTALRVVGLTKDHLNPLATKITFTRLQERLSGVVAIG